MTGVVIYDNVPDVRKTRPISWIRGALKDFEAFPSGARDQAADALTVIVEGGAPDVAKPMKGLGSGVWELAIKERGDAYRVVYALQLDDDIWVVHAFQKKSKSGIGTPRSDVDLVERRLKALLARYESNQELGE